MCSTFPLIICFKGLQLPRLSDYCQHPLKVAVGKEIGLLICLQIQFPSVLLPSKAQISSEIFPPTESSVYSRPHSALTV